MKNVTVFVFMILFSLISVASNNTENLKLKIESKEYSLFKYSDTQEEYFGVYREYSADTGGIALHLFPDHTFIYTEFCDICEEEAVANGTFSYNKSKLSLKFNSEYKGQKSAEYELRYGQVVKGDVLSGFIAVFFDDKQFKKIKVDPESYDFWITDNPYYDWVNIKKRLQVK